MLKRIINFLKARINKILGKIEDPIELFELKIRNLKESTRKAKADSCEFIGQTKKEEEKLKLAKENLKKFDIAIKNAINQGNKEDAKKILMEKHDEEEKIKIMEVSYNKNKELSDKIIKQININEKEIDRLELKKEEFRSRLATAELRIKLNESLTGFDLDGISEKDILKEIESKDAQAEGLDILLSNSENENVSIVDKYSSISYSDEDLEKELELYI